MALVLPALQSYRNAGRSIGYSIILPIYGMRLSARMGIGSGVGTGGSGGSMNRPPRAPGPPE